MRRRNRHNHDSEDAPIWDAKTKKTMIVTFIFLAAGLLFAWEFGQIYGKAESGRPADAKAREATFWSQMTFLNPDLDPELRAAATEMGWRACDKLESGWDPTRVLAFLSEDNAAGNNRLPMPATQVQFWIGLEQSATMSLCPEQEPKLKGWLENFEPKPVPSPTVTETA